ncbi:MAG: hypothetical protein R3343_01360 [Nitriliruptorales bacterium]|nr:hypothetical protein [Nitriliruptorales bacterium]
MTMSMPPHMPGSRRAIPTAMSTEGVKRLRALLDQGDEWILRPHWEKYLRGEHDGGADIDELSRDQRWAARAWLAQQRHEIYRKLEGEEAAPDGWLESLPLFQALTDEAAERRS